MKLHASGEDYLEAILVLHKADGYILSCIEPYGRCAMTFPSGSERSTLGRKADAALCGR